MVGLVLFNTTLIHMMLFNMMLFHITLAHVMLFHITLFQTKSNNINRLITITDDFYLVNGMLKCDHIKRLSLYF